MDINHKPSSQREKVTLPHNAERLQEQLRAFSIHQTFQKPLETQPEWFRKTLKYAIPSLSNGRSLNEVRVIAVGESQIQKRSIVSGLLHDKLPHTPVKVSSDEIYIYSNTVSVQDGNATIELDVVANIVDMCTDKNINKCKSNHIKDKDHLVSSLKTFHLVRKIPPQLQSLLKGCKPVEYPNLVLYFAKYGSEQFSSTMKFQLFQLRKMNLVDTALNNLVLIMLPNTDTDNSTSVSDKKPLPKPDQLQGEVRKLLQKAFHNIRGVPILIVEDGTLQDEENKSKLRESILKSAKQLFAESKDNLGILLLSKLIGSEEDSATVLDDAHSIDVTDWTMFAPRSEKWAPEVREQPSLHHGHHSIGQAYCPVSETMKMENVFQGKQQKMKSLVVGDTLFQVPVCVDVFQDVSTNCWSLSCKSKHAYESNKKADYGLEANIELCVNINSGGKWESGSTSSRSNVSDAILHEVRLAFLQVMNPDEYFCDGIKQDLKNLVQDFPNYSRTKSDEGQQTDNNRQPLEISSTGLAQRHVETQTFDGESQDTEESRTSRYNAFFSKWGTHFICKQWLGGYIKTDWNKEKKGGQHHHGFFTTLAGKVLFGSRKGNVAAEGSAKKNLFKVNKDGQLSMSGHEHDDLMYLDFDEISPELYYNWVNEVKRHPNGLNFKFVLYPYYNSKHCKNKDEMRKRTQEYLLSETHASKKSAHGCLPASATVRMWNGRKKLISKLEPYDTLVTVGMDGHRNLHRNLRSHSKFFTFLHKETVKKAIFLVLTFSNGKALKLTPNHLIFVLDCDGCYPESRQAQNMKIGERIIYVNSDGCADTPTLVAISYEESCGVFCPLTSTGTFLADGFMVTSYASIDSFTTAHCLMAPLRFWHELKFILKVKDQQSIVEEGVHAYPAALLSLFNFLDARQSFPKYRFSKFNFENSCMKKIKLSRDIWGALLAWAILLASALCYFCN